MVEFWPYSNIFNLESLPETLILRDHLGGFDKNNYNLVLNTLNDLAQKNNVVFPVNSQYIFNGDIIKKYKNLSLKFDAELHNRLLSRLSGYRKHPAINYKNFICSFNGSAHVSRQLLVSILQKFGYFDPTYCSKNFSYTLDTLDGNIEEYTGTNSRFYRKFFIADNSEEFFQKIYSFGHVRFDHATNIYNLENKITQSFIHIVSETMATSYYPLISEKCLYSVVTRGLFLSYAQPGWHDHMENCYGFKKYNRLFDYKFDTIQNPVERLVELMCMVSKFRTLSCHDWHDLYLMEKDTIEFNYHHYHSKQYQLNLGAGLI
jgi:hypothetical protein